MSPEFAVSLSYRTSQKTGKPSKQQGPGRARARLQPERLYLRLVFRHSNMQQGGNQGLHGGSVVSPGLHWGKAGLQAEGGWVSVGCLGLLRVWKDNMATTYTATPQRECGPQP